MTRFACRLALLASLLPAAALADPAGATPPSDQPGAQPALAQGDQPAAAPAVVVVPSYQMKSGHMLCGEHQSFDLASVDADASEVRLTWKGRHYDMVREATTSGAYHFDDDKDGLVMIQIPAKSMLFDHKHMTRLADDCNPVVASQ